MTKQFSIVVFGQFFSQFGDNLFSIAIAWYLADLTGNPLLIGVVTAVFNVIPLCNTLTGAFADRHHKLPIMLSVTVCQIAVLGVGVAVLQFSSLPVVAALIAIQVACRIAGCFFDPALTVLIPQLVDEDALQQANGINQGVMLIGQIFGTVVGGILVSAMSPAVFLIVNMALYAVTLICLVVVRSMHRERMDDEDEDKGHWYAGLVFISKHAVLMHIVALAVIVNFALGPILSMDALWVSDYLHLSSSAFGGIEAAFVVGAILGSVLTGNIQVPFKAKMLGALFLMGLAVGVMSLFPSFAVSLAANALVGFAGGIVNVALYTIVQTYVPNEMLGRVSGALLALTTVSQPLGMAVGGAVADAVGLRILFLAGAALTLVVAVGSLAVRWDLGELRKS
ncbi:MFS transporter [Bifidobacterium avesanii]|nr:MFS transporter [Bifidobacterium avesanii]